MCANTLIELARTRETRDGGTTIPIFFFRGYFDWIAYEFWIVVFYSSRDFSRPSSGQPFESPQPVSACSNEEWIEKAFGQRQGSNCNIASFSGDRKGLKTICRFTQDSPRKVCYSLSFSNVTTPLSCLKRRKLNRRLIQEEFLDLLDAQVRILQCSQREEWDL